MPRTWRDAARDIAQQLLESGRPCTAEAVAAELDQLGAWRSENASGRKRARIALVRQELTDWRDERGQRVLVATLLTIDGKRCPVYRRAAPAPAVRSRRRHTAAWWDRRLWADVAGMTEDLGPETATAMLSALLPSAGPTRASR